MADLYLWIKALHVISVIAWMAGMLYLPRLFVYHVDAPKGSQQSETFKIMERRLLKAIINPAMIATWVFGLAMVVMGDLWDQPWLWAKLAAGADHAGDARAVLALAARLRQRCQHAAGKNLSHRQRSPDRADDRHRHSGDR